LVLHSGYSRHHWLRGGDRPTPTQPAEIETIKAQIAESEDTEKPKVNFEVGETVKITDGPFLNFSGVIEESNLNEAS